MSTIYSHSLSNTRTNTPPLPDYRQFQALIEHAPVAMFLVADDGKFVYVNPMFQEIFGYDPDEIPDGRTWFRLAYPDPLYRKEVISTWIEDRENHQPGEKRIRVFDVVCKDGSRKVIKFIPVCLPDGEDVVTCWDITEQLLLENQFQQAQKMEAVGVLAGGVAHDFNNLLQAISGYCHLLLHNKTPEHPDYDRLMTIEKVVERAAQLVRQLLFFSRKAPSRREKLNPNTVVQEAARILERAIPRMVDVHLEFAPDVHAVIADPVQMEQTLLNLGINAADAMPSGGRLVIRTENVPIEAKNTGMEFPSPPGPYVRIRVSDTGVGIDKETLKHIFEPFFTTKGIGKGTGLGLSSVYGIVKSHGGYIHCDSTPGRGTTFDIYLPASSSLDESPTKHLSPVFALGGSETILFVDDVEDIRELVFQALQRYGYTVFTAADGEEALRIHDESRQPIDLTILDVGMPGMGGKQCLAELLHRNPSVQVLIASGYPDEDLMNRFRDYGASGAIAKPYHVSGLLAAIRKILDSHRSDITAGHPLR